MRTLKRRHKGPKDDCKAPSSKSFNRLELSPFSFENTVRQWPFYSVLPIYFLLTHGTVEK
jgi:hypothetical protein